MKKYSIIVIALLLLLTLSACQFQQSLSAWLATDTPTPTLTFTPTVTLTPTATATLTLTPTFTATFTATPTNTPYPTKTQAPVSMGGSEGCSGANSNFEAQVVALINKERANAGLSALSTNGSLTSAARGHSRDMASSNFFGHTGSNGSDLASRLSAAGYAYTAGAENIYAGEGSNLDNPYAAVSAWMGSDGHRANILNGIYTEIGVGYWCDTNSKYEGYFTADFGDR